MTPIEFSKILQHTEALSPEQTLSLNSIIDAFPYFQPARALYLKGLKDQHSFKYNQALKTTAAYTTDRSVLFDFITSETFNQNEISHFIKENKNKLHDIPVTEERIVPKFENNPKISEPPISRSIFELDILEPIELKADVNPEDILNLGKPLEFNKNETHSFNEWLKLTRHEPIVRPLESQDERDIKFRLIDKFIKENPKINPSSNATAKGNLAKDQMIKPEALMTETLARIYTEQKNYSKAIQAYHILSLKYPEKSIFFANQIKAIQHIQEQNNLE